MKILGNALLSFLAIASLLAVGYFCGVVTFTYPDFDRRTALTEPLHVNSVNGRVIRLSDDRSLEMPDPALGIDWQEKIEASHQMVEVDTDGETPDAWVYGDCPIRSGTGTRANWLRIPIFPDHSKVNQRVLIAIAKKRAGNPEIPLGPKSP